MQYTRRCGLVGAGLPTAAGCTSIAVTIVISPVPHDVGIVLPGELPLAPELVRPFDEPRTKANSLRLDLPKGVQVANQPFYLNRNVLFGKLVDDSTTRD